jgi:superfamily II DNA or RNA helicase
LYLFGIHSNNGSQKKFTQVVGRALRKFNKFDQGTSKIVSFESNKEKYQKMIYRLRGSSNDKNISSKGLRGGIPSSQRIF